jgi:uncharacterized protein (DUF1330 family)
MFIVLTAAFATACLVGLWIVGAQERVYSIASGDWFVAVRDKPSAPPLALAQGVSCKWSAGADFAFIGADDAYWSRFYILAGGDPRHTPIELSGAEDAYIARVKLAAPPKLALGVLRVLIAVGLLSKPRGDVGGDVQAKGYRAELMPNQTAVTRLLAQPAEYAPAMVNFLRYYPAARYKDGTAASGHNAYTRYGMVALRTVYRTGGRLLFYGRVLEVLREASDGLTTGAWNDIAAMQYPNPAAILSMEHVTDYRAALHHRDAGLERTVVIASSEQGLT